MWRVVPIDPPLVAGLGSRQIHPERGSPGGQVLIIMPSFYYSFLDMML